MAFYQSLTFTFDHAEYYIPYFQQHNITDVIRLNCNEYDKTKFLRAGIRHHDMYFVDGTKPPLRIVNKYLEIVEGTTGAVAVHCKGTFQANTNWFVQDTHCCWFI